MVRSAESLAVSGEGREGLASLGNLSIFNAEAEGWVLEHGENKMSNPEIGCTEFVAAQERSSGTEWLKESQELVKHFEVLLSFLIKSAVRFTENGIASLVEDIVIGVSDHVTLLCSHRVIRVVAVLQAKVSNGSSSRATLHFAIRSLQLRKATSWEMWFECWPVWKINWIVIEFLSTVGQDKSEGLGSSISIEVPDSVFWKLFAEGSKTA